MQQKQWLIKFEDIDTHNVELVGGKGANLGEMLKFNIPVPLGFCITTEAYDYFLSHNQLNSKITEQLMKLENGTSLKDIVSNLRELFLSAPIPDDLQNDISDMLTKFGLEKGYAIRSSATSEDSLNASFAGQLETSLNVHGVNEIILKIKAGWASLFNDRSITYRQTNKIAHDSVKIAIIIQQMVNSEKSGIMFTADPLTENRNIISIDAGFGLGEALVSGIVSADNFRVDKKFWKIVSQKITQKEIALTLTSTNESGLVQQNLPPEKQKTPSLTDQEVIALAQIGQNIENHYKCPQDIEWAIVAGKIYITQTRPITTLYPLLRPIDDLPHLYINFNYVQVMMDPIRPLGQSVIQMIVIGNIHEHNEEKSIAFPAGGRLFFDITPLLTLKPFREKAPEMISFMVDSAFGQALKSGIEKLEPYIHQIPSARKQGMKFFRKLPSIIVRGLINIFVRDPGELFKKSNQYLDVQVEEYTKALLSVEKPLELLFKIEEVLHQVLLKSIITVAPVLLSVVLPFNFLKKMLTQKGLDKELADITRGLVGNITTQMDMEVASLTDILMQNDNNIHAKEFQDKFGEFLQKFGMRGPSEIDITRDRYNENQSILISIIEGNKLNKTPRSHFIHYQELTKKSHESEIKILQNFSGPKKYIVRRFIKVYRNMMPFRESPKYMMIRVFWVIKQQLLKIGNHLQHTGFIQTQKDIYYLHLSEIQFILENQQNQQLEEIKRIKQLIETRKHDHERFFKLQPPKFLTGDGEIMRGKGTNEKLPDGAIRGASVSVGIIEGIAHVIRDPNKEVLLKGEILITAFTDPGWTPLFINAAGLVMEVGGMMTHGSVIAREYGIPAIVGVENATRLIKTGQKIRLNADIGILEFLEKV